MAKQTKITIETNSLLIVQSRTSRRAWCPQCAAYVEVIALSSVQLTSNLEPAAANSESAAPANLEKWLNSTEVHQLQTADGTLICLNSVLSRVTNKKIR